MNKSEIIFNKLSGISNYADILGLATLGVAGSLHKKNNGDTATGATAAGVAAGTGTAAILKYHPKFKNMSIPKGVKPGTIALGALAGAGAYGLGRLLTKENK